jgi:hypothetical protein
MKKKKINTRNKMHATNSVIRKKLIALGFESMYSFPHMRFTKDYHLIGCGFDMFAVQGKDIWFLQFKSNKNCSKKEMEKYKVIESLINCKCGWITKNDRDGIYFYNTENPKGIRLE